LHPGNPGNRPFEVRGPENTLEGQITECYY
jgi:hypothetical protein